MGNSGSSPQMVNSFLHPIQRMLKQRDLKVSDRTIKGFLEDIDQAAQWFRASGDVNLPCWEKLGWDLTEAKGRGELRPGTLPLWCLIRYCLKDGKCIDILHEGRRALSAHQDSMSESDNKERGNLKEERPKSSKASSKLHTKVEKEKETDQGKKEKETDQGKTKQKPLGLYPVLDEFKQKPSGLYPVLDEFKQKPSGLYLVLDEFADLTLSDSAEDELDSEEEEDGKDNHYPKDNLLLFIIHHPVIFPKVTAMEPLKGVTEIYTDGSKSGVGAYVLQGQDPVQFRFQPNTPQIVECQIVYEVFKRFHEPFNLFSDSHYVVNVVRGLETSAFIKESSPVHDILWDICVLIRNRTAPFFIGHIRAHTLLPGPMTAANDLADKATRAFAAVELDSKPMAKQFHQLYHVPAHTLCLKFKISQQLA
ncbi:hypothetical protein STEG23_035600 [Scotinomys teguina]